MNSIHRAHYGSSVNKKDPRDASERLPALMETIHHSNRKFSYSRRRTKHCPVMPTIHGVFVFCGIAKIRWHIIRSYAIAMRNLVTIWSRPNERGRNQRMNRFADLLRLTPERQHYV